MSHNLLLINNESLELPVGSPLFWMNKNFIASIVEIPEIHVPKLEVTMCDFLWESDQDWEMIWVSIDIIWQFDFAYEAVSAWAISSIANLPCINNL